VENMSYYFEMIAYLKSNSSAEFQNFDSTIKYLKVESKFQILSHFRDENEMQKV